MRCVIIYLLIAIVSIVGLYVCVVFLNMLYNNAHALSMASSIAEMAHPAESHHVKGVWKVANFGQSNHCDWAGGEIRSATMSREEIEEFYRRRVVESYKTPDNSFEIDFPNDKRHYDPGDDILAELEHVASTTSNETVYLVLAIDAMHSAGEDPRCH